MSDGERDPDDDPGLRAMRSVWIEMRDEEPPARGMAELLAAAREHAARPAPVPGWRRALDAIASAFRRPPVLALASVVVLVGGAVLVTRHSDEMTSKPAVQTGSATRGLPEVAPSAPARTTTAPLEQAAPETRDLEETEKKVMQAPGHPRPEPASVVKPPAMKDGVGVPHGGTGGGGAVNGDDDMRGPTFAQPPPADLPAPVSPPVQTPTTTAPAPEPSPPPSPPPQPAQVGAHHTAPATGSGASPRAPQTDNGKTCRAAASRGDCATARACTGKLAANERAEATNDPALAKCLAE